MSDDFETLKPGQTEIAQWRSWQERQPAPPVVQPMDGGAPRHFARRLAEEKAALDLWVRSSEHWQREALAQRQEIRMLRRAVLVAGVVGAIVAAAVVWWGVTR